MVQWKCIIWAKYDLPIINLVCESVWFTINGLWKCYFLIFAFFVFPNFKWLLSKILWKKTEWISRVLVKLYYVTNIFDLQILYNDTTVLLELFEIYTEMHFFSVSFFGNRKRLKNNEKCFLFQLKSSFRSQDIQMFVLTFWSCGKNGLIRKIRLISKFMVLQPGYSKQLQYTIVQYLTKWRQSGNEVLFLKNDAIYFNSLQLCIQ